MKNYRKALIFIALFFVFLPFASVVYATNYTVKVNKTTISANPKTIPIVDDAFWTSNDFLISFSDKDIKSGKIKATFKGAYKGIYGKKGLNTEKITSSLNLNGTIDLSTFAITGAFTGERNNQKGAYVSAPQAYLSYSFRGSLSTTQTDISPGSPPETADEVLAALKKEPFINFNGDAELFFNSIQGFNATSLYYKAGPKYEGPFSLSLESLLVPNKVAEDNSNSGNTEKEESFIGPAEILSDDGAPTLSPFTPPNKKRILDSFMVELPTEKARHFRKIIDGYYEKIPKGPIAGEKTYLGILPGQLNAFFGSRDRVCGAYQHKVLDYLQSLRFNNDPAKRALMEGFDYGPIQIGKGGHQAVVVFPKNKDWQTEGLVLDPWPLQKPEVYSLSHWNEMFLGDAEGAVGNYFFPIEGNIGRYPTTPNPDGSFKYIDESKPLTIKSKRKNLLVKSPVFVLVKSADGKRVGIDENGKFVNDFGAEVDANMFLKPDKTYTSSFSLPANNEYSVAMTGSGSGDVHVFASTEENTAQQFDRVAVKKGDHLKFYWDDLNGFPNLKDTNEMVVSSTEFVSPFAKKNNNLNLIFIAAIIIFMIVAILAVLVGALAIIRRLEKKH